MKVIYIGKTSESLTYKKEYFANFYIDVYYLHSNNGNRLWFTEEKFHKSFKTISDIRQEKIDKLWEK